MKKYNYIFFDLDGTLTNPERGLVSSFAYGLSKMGVDVSDREALKRFIGPPLREEWQAVYGFTPDEAEEAIRLFREYFSVYGWWDNEPYPGISDVLSRLKNSGKRLAVASSKPEIFAKKILDLFELSQYFDFIGGALQDKSRDKKSQVLEFVIDSLGVSEKDECILVGDRKFDAEGAAACGIDSLGVAYGHGTREEIDRASFTYVVNTVDDILCLL